MRTSKEIMIDYQFIPYSDEKESEFIRLFRKVPEREKSFMYNIAKSQEFVQQQMKADNRNGLVLIKK